VIDPAGSTLVRTGLYTLRYTDKPMLSRPAVPVGWPLYVYAYNDSIYSLQVHGRNGNNKRVNLTNYSLSCGHKYDTTTIRGYDKEVTC